MKSSWRGFGSQKPFQGSSKLHEHEVLFQFAILDESSGLLLGRVDRANMLGVLKSLSFSLMGYAVKNRVIVLVNRHISILWGEEAQIRVAQC